MMIWSDRLLKFVAPQYSWRRSCPSTIDAIATDFTEKHCPPIRKIKLVWLDSKETQNLFAWRRRLSRIYGIARFYADPHERPQKRGWNRKLWKQFDSIAPDDLVDMVFDATIKKIEIARRQLMNENSLELKLASFQGDLVKVKALLESGANPNSVDEHGSGTLLNFHPHITSYLLKNGADPNCQTNEFGASVLAGLCYVSQIDCVKLILEHGADPNLGRKATLETPLHHGISNDASSELIELLIKHGADVNAKTIPGLYSYNFHGDTPTRGETPLHRAASYATAETIKLLLNAGADRQANDVNGNTPHHWAGWSRRSSEIVAMLAPEV